MASRLQERIFPKIYLYPGMLGMYSGILRRNLHFHVSYPGNSCWVQKKFPVYNFVSSDLVCECGMQFHKKITHFQKLNFIKKQHKYHELSNKKINKTFSLPHNKITTSFINICLSLSWEPFVYVQKKFKRKVNHFIVCHIYSTC